MSNQTRGGGLHFDRNHWIQERLEFASGALQKRFSFLYLSQTFSSYRREMPCSTVVSTTSVLDDKFKVVSRIVNTQFYMPNDLQ